MITKFAVEKIRLEMYGDILLTMLGEQYHEYFLRCNLYCFIQGYLNRSVLRAPS